MMNAINYSDEVKQAKKENKAIVAVETGYLYHKDANTNTLACAMNCLDAIEKSGAVPAVIALIDGVLQIGLTRDELTNFLQDKAVVKCNMRDIAWAIMKRKKGATTVSAALHAAALANIPVLAAGGIGGVHRQGETTLDISSDLIQLAKTPVAVVCSGAKAILDIPRTMEYIETQSITVVGYKTKKMPAYYLSATNFTLENVAKTPKEVAQLIKCKMLIKDRGGTIVANPIEEKYALDPENFNQIIEKALKKAEQKGIKGKAVTAYLLDEVSEETKGKASLATSHMQIKNAEIAGQIAVELI